VPQTPGKLPDFVSWPSFPFEGDLRVKPLEPVVDVEPPRDGEDIANCPACAASDEAYIWVSERWRVRAMEQPGGLPMVLILESRSHLDLGDLPNLLAAELGVMTVRLERAIRSLDGVARVHVNRWGDGSAHLHLWFLARPSGRLQLRGSFLSLWNDILPAVPEAQWRENLALVAAWLAEFGGRPLAEPPRIEWQAPSRFTQEAAGTSASPTPQTPGSMAALPAGVAQPGAEGAANGSASAVAAPPPGAIAPEVGTPAIGRAQVVDSSNGADGATPTEQPSNPPTVSNGVAVNNGVIANEGDGIASDVRTERLGAPPVPAPRTSPEAPAEAGAGGAKAAAA
jgi:hypothetical protein